MPDRDPRDPRRPARRVVGGAIASLVLIVVAIWIVWGFRWPPTVAVVEEPDTADAETVRLEDGGPGPGER